MRNVNRTNSGLVKITSEDSLTVYMKSANDGMSEMYLHLFWFYKSNRQYSRTINICIKAFLDTKKFMFITRLFYSLHFLMRMS